jgi:hypothetical protein
MEARLETSDSTSLSCFMLSPEQIVWSKAAGSMLKKNVPRERERESIGKVRIGFNLPSTEVQHSYQTFPRVENILTSTIVQKNEYAESP